MRSYKNWHLHGEEYVFASERIAEFASTECANDPDDMIGMVQDAFGINDSIHSCCPPEDVFRNS